MITRVQKLCKQCGIEFQSMIGTSALLCSDCQFPLAIENKNNPQEIIIRPELIDASKLEDFRNRVFWRPTEFSEYIGQTNLKQILQGYIKGCKNLDKPFPHFLVSGKAGGGKTAIAYILAKQLGVPFVEAVANTIVSPQQFIDKLVEVNGGVLFIDELQVVNKKIANFILPIMEDFQINGKQIKPFSLFSATTELGSLLKKFKPLVDRFKINTTLDGYTIEELATLAKQYKYKNFPNTEIEPDKYLQIAMNCRGTPRIAIRLLESYIFMGVPLEQVFKAYHIVKNSITQNDVKVLKLLAEKEKGIGISTICSYLQTSNENYLYEIEMYLIEQGLLTIGNRRQITLKGKEFLNGLSKM